MSVGAGTSGQGQQGQGQGPPGASGGANSATAQPLSPPSKGSVFVGVTSAEGGSDSAGEEPRGHGTSPPATGTQPDGGGHSATAGSQHATATAVVSVEEESFFTRKAQKFPTTLFDKLEQMVWDSVVTAHSSSFLASPLCKQYQQFLYISKKAVTEEDFTLFRVLGRGGFGQVNGQFPSLSRLPWGGLGQALMHVHAWQAASDVRLESCTP